MTQERRFWGVGSWRASPSAIRLNQSARFMRRDLLLSGIGALAVWRGVGAAPVMADTSPAPVQDLGVARFMDVSHCLTDRSAAPE